MFPLQNKPYRQPEFDDHHTEFVGEAQVSPIDYSDPSFIPAHVIVFDCDTFGVLLLTITSISLYSRVNENFGAVNYCECGANKPESS